MKKNDVTVGMKVTTSSHISATIYTVREITEDGIGIRLVYQVGNGEWVEGGWVDYSLLETPTIKQLLLRLTEIEGELPPL